MPSFLNKLFELGGNRAKIVKNSENITFSKTLFIEKILENLYNFSAPIGHN